MCRGGRRFGGSILRKMRIHEYATRTTHRYRDSGCKRRGSSQSLKKPGTDEGEYRADIELSIGSNEFALAQRDRNEMERTRLELGRKRERPGTSTGEIYLHMETERENVKEVEELEQVETGD